MKEAYIVDALRTPIGSFRGALAPIRADDLAAIPIKALLEKYPNLPKDVIDDVILGCHNQAGEDNRNVARMALLLAGIPYSVPGETVNRLCSSGMSTVVQANRAIKAGDGDVFIVGGMEHMSRGPYVMSKASIAFGNDSKMEDSSFGWRFVNPKLKEMYGTDAMGVTAENLAELFNISREDQDLFAYNSQMKASKAQQNGILAEEICPVDIPQRKGDPMVVDQDEFIRPSTTLEKLSTLRTVFKKDGTVTAGNSSGLNDGAAAMLVVSEDALKKYNLTPKARIVASAVVGVEPRIMGIGPVYATKKALLKAGLKLSDMDVMEFNEAFSSQALACIRELGLADDDTRINPNGGAIALGHPLGMSGTRIIQAATNQLIRSGGKYGLATMCVGVGMGYAIIIERIK
ncbi:3-oxoadipyl-CoA thiolase [Maribacter sp. MMG018]|uniref:3-oxoadipyl-CoA thiolase n=1 Tax=Maribacter sp. MMG018 TaxID=2822688 RepID=UPI001B3853B2|nr:3-oxoadipyl-CoA thiolase [Maribacter sp. MMG018]MBQ4913257.1 3-oxoadipyl-CoA thiolase [Maribacter sp. MMG018]